MCFVVCDCIPATPVMLPILERGLKFKKMNHACRVPKVMENPGIIIESHGKKSWIFVLFQELVEN